MLTRLLALSALLVALAAAGCGDDEARSGKATPARTQAEDPAKAEERAAGEAVRQFRLFEILGQFGRLYDGLHPSHRRFLRRGQFESCWRAATADEQPINDPVVRVVEVYDDPLDIPYIPDKTSKAVTLRVSYKNTIGEGPEEIPVDTQTTHVVDRDGWKWVLSADAARAAKRGECFATGQAL